MSWFPVVKLKNAGGTLVNPATEDTLALIKSTDGIKKITDPVAVTNSDITAVKTAVEIMDDWDDSDSCKVKLQAGTNAVGKLVPPDTDASTASVVRKYYTNAGAVTDGIVWSPASGKRWHITSLYFQTSADATITFEDDKSGGDDPVLKGEFKAGSGLSLTFDPAYPFASGEDDADLIVTTSAGNIYVTAVGYDV